jgi:deoxycytidine triphosphate deaminase
MDLLRDEELLSDVARRNQVSNVPEPVDWNGKNSPIQPTSLDLHVGDIYLPQKPPNKPGGKDNSLASYILRPGETAIVMTAEELKLNPDISAFGFSPSRVAFKGILLTNPGHIDPGFQGRVRLAVINMGRENHCIRSGDVIFTVLFVKLRKPVVSDWYARNGAPLGPINQSDIDALSADFLDVDERARVIAEKAVSRAEIRVKYIAPLITALIAAAASFGFAWLQPLNELKQKVAQLESKVDVESLKYRIERLEERVPRASPAQGKSTR